MILKAFKDNYDAEFVKLMMEVQNLLDDFCKSDKLKINSWAKKLCIPTINIEFKKNRNLYAIKLLDNVCNGKLEDPFTKFAKEKEIKLLDPILVKTQLTNKFLNYIKQLEEDENIYNNPNINNYNYIKSKDKLRNKSQKKKSLIQLIKQENKPNRRQQNKNNNFAIDYYNQILLSPFRQRSKTFYKTKNINNNKNDNNKYENNIKLSNFNPGDILLMNNYDNFPYRKKSEIMELKPKTYNGYNKYEKYKLRNIVSMLKIQRRENNEIILNNQNEIVKLKKRLSLMSVKLKKIFELQN